MIQMGWGSGSAGTVGTRTQGLAGAGILGVPGNHMGVLPSPASSAGSAPRPVPATALTVTVPRHLLTAREREVAALIARGQTNRAIAARLVISERTADTHVQHILNKLGLDSRAQIAAWAAEHGLLKTPQSK